ncbi:hypothetical protein GYMLUDRAFT_34215 [Collybiopsis luxurians FD-317 M1]|nr:hypothetical protein GYMLUDRAFT_34215 [Collybiopsis luxurians FD-317 M1]
MRTIGSTGHLWSYEFHETRANKAKQEFIRHGLSDRVTLTHRNVCKDGFTVLDTADSLFLDLPAPWDAVEHAKKALRKDRITRICCFSPCMEQVLRTVSALNEAGFTDIAMYETLLRPYEVQQTSALPTIGEVSDRLKQSEIKREEKRLKQIASGHRGNTEPPSAAKSPDGLQFSSHREKRKRHGSDAEAEDLEQFPVGGKKTKTEEVETSDMTTGPESQSATPKDIEMNESSLLVKIEEKMAKPVPPPAPPMKLNLARVMPEVRGHTSYLTFACLLPPVPARASDISDANVSSSSATPEKV